MPRAGLSRDLVVAEAARVADEVGFDRLTLAAVASRLGVRLPSLYKHVAGLDALRVHVAAVAARELAAELSAAAVGRSGPEALVETAVAYREYARRRPGAYAATLAAPGGDSEHREAAEALLRVVLAVLAGFRLEDDDAVDAVRGLRALLHGFVAIENAGGFRLPRDLDCSYRRLVETYAQGLASWSWSSAAAAAVSP